MITIVKPSRKRQREEETPTPGLVFRELRKPDTPGRIRGVCLGPHKEEDKCPVCLNELKGAHVKTTCGHCFHYACAETWCNTVDPEDNNKKVPLCPACRTPIKRQQIAAFVSR
jgi:hypothetical protein